MVEVLPAPFGPRKATISPGRTVRSSPATAVTVSYRFTRPLSSMAGGPSWLLALRGPAPGPVVVLIPVSMAQTVPAGKPRAACEASSPDHAICHASRTLSIHYFGVLQRRG